ncbi:lipoprotein [Massilia sp. PWRC2]|uniref:lipoprotein n=1 Tax=Massilia sp. PWRC2 TaxID=2804626 RepID=UPI003CF12CDB
MRRIILATTAAVLLSACTAMLPPRLQAQEFAQSARPQAEAGQMKWSDYYGAMYRTIADGRPEAGSTDRMKIFGMMRTNALAYEDGQITREQFFGRQRSADESYMSVAERDLATQARLDASRPRGKSAADEYAEKAAARARESGPINCTSSTAAGMTSTHCD